MTPSSEDREIEEALVLQFLGGSEEAFTLLSQRFLPIIRCLALRYCRDARNVEDFMQEGQVALFSAARTYRVQKGASFRTYASVCIRHRMVSLCRREADCEDATDWQDEAEQDIRMSSTGEDPAQLLVQQETAERLEQWLQQTLSLREYQVLRLHISGYRYDQIAQQLQCPVKAVDNAWQRAQRKLSSSDFRSLPENTV